jgi:hypothetical protein
MTLRSLSGRAVHDGSGALALPLPKDRTNMSTLRILIDLDNDAFGGGEESYEAARILRELAKRIEDPSADLMHGLALYDINGNTVGRAQEVEA